MPAFESLSLDKQQFVRNTLQKPILARLATANPQTLQPHVVPVWFYWDGESIWISAFSSTRKIKDLEKNKRCSILIEPNNIEGIPSTAVLLEGKADLIEEPKSIVADISIKIYTRYMGEEGVKAKEPQSWSVDPENRLIRLNPTNIFIW